MSDKRKNSGRGEEAEADEEKEDTEKQEKHKSRSLVAWEKEEWEKDEGDRCRKKLYQLIFDEEEEFDKDSFTIDFFETNSNRFHYLHSVPSEDKECELRQHYFGCGHTYLTKIRHVDYISKVCGLCKGAPLSCGQIAAKTALDLPSCLGVSDVFVFFQPIHEATLLLPVLPCVTFQDTKDPFYIRTQLRNSRGLMKLDLYSGIRDILKSRIDDPMLSTCLQYVYPHVDWRVREKANLDIQERTPNRLFSFPAESHVDDPTAIERLVDFPFYASSKPSGIQAFTEKGRVFIVISMEQ